jgi:hypothetical protein
MSIGVEFITVYESADYQEGIRAFHGEREPAFAER